MEQFVAVLQMIQQKKWWQLNPAPISVVAEHKLKVVTPTRLLRKSDMVVKPAWFYFRSVKYHANSTISTIFRIPPPSLICCSLWISQKYPQFFTLGITIIALAYTHSHTKHGRSCGKWPKSEFTWPHPSIIPSPGLDLLSSLRGLRCLGAVNLKFQDADRIYGGPRSVAVFLHYRWNICFVCSPHLIKGVICVGGLFW